MHLNKLLFNVSKPDLLVAHTPSALKNCAVPRLSQPAQKVGVQFEAPLSFDHRVSHICKVSFQLQKLFKMHISPPFLVVVVFFSSSPLGHATEQQALWLMDLSTCIFRILLVCLKLPCADPSSSKAWLHQNSLSWAGKHAGANELWLLTPCIHFSTVPCSELSSFILSPVAANGSYLNFLYPWHVFYSVLMSERGKKKPTTVS